MVCNHSVHVGCTALPAKGHICARSVEIYYRTLSGYPAWDLFRLIDGLYMLLKMKLWPRVKPVQTEQGRCWSKKMRCNDAIDAVVSQERIVYTYIVIFITHVSYESLYVLYYSSKFPLRYCSVACDIIPTHSSIDNWDGKSLLVCCHPRKPMPYLVLGVMLKQASSSSCSLLSCNITLTFLASVPICLI